jgi:hypothetical protein
LIDHVFPEIFNSNDQESFFSIEQTSRTLGYVSFGNKYNLAGRFVNILKAGVNSKQLNEIKDRFYEQTKDEITFQIN